MFSTQPLCRLQQLQRLEVDSASTPAAQLQQLGQRARSLCSVVLHHQSAQYANRSAAGWLALPLHALQVDVRDCPVNVVRHSTLQCISRLQGVTDLDLIGCKFVETAEWQLAEVVAQLTGLQSLGLLDLQFKTKGELNIFLDFFEEARENWQEAAAEVGQHPAWDVAGALELALPAAAQQPAAGVPAAADAGFGFAAADAGFGFAAADEGFGFAAAAAPTEPELLGWPAILRAAAQLPQLRSLILDASLSAAAVAELVAATQLEVLRIDNPSAGKQNWQQDSPSEPLLVVLLYQLTGLRSLSLDNQPHLGNTAMHVIGKRLTGLTRLSIDNCRVTDAGLACLTGLQQLRYERESSYMWVQSPSQMV
jgi:hypothetical protein